MAFLMEKDSKEIFEIKDDEMIIIGRGESCSIRIDNDKRVSKLHAKISRDATGACRILDLNSSNGTFVNGQLVLDGYLKNGDCILVGGSILTFHEDIR